MKAALSADVGAQSELVSADEDAQHRAWQSCDRHRRVFSVVQLHEDSANQLRPRPACPPCSSPLRRGLTELGEEPVELPVQLRATQRADHPNHQIHVRQPRPLPAKAIPDDPLDAISRRSSGNRFLTHDKPKPGAVHSIENNVET